MIYDWYKIFNLAEFNALGLVSREYELDLEGIGLKTILVTKGCGVGLLYDGIFLMVELNDKNPFEFEDHAVYLAENDDVYLGIKVEDEN